MVGHGAVLREVLAATIESPGNGHVEGTAQYEDDANRCVIGKQRFADPTAVERVVNTTE